MFFGSQGQPCPPRIHPACGQQPGIRSPAQLRSNLPALGSPARENAGAQGSGQPEGDVQQQDPSRESGEDGDGCQEGAAVPCARPAQRRVPELHRRRRAQLDQMPQWLVAGLKQAGSQHRDALPCIRPQLTRLLHRHDDRFQPLALNSAHSEVEEEHTDEIAPHDQDLHLTAQDTSSRPLLKAFEYCKASLQGQAAWHQ
ncbi:hypothetical protein WJX84_012051 [Apatococcus fuscideae]|uniref:Uncharacterized protein n=1 Tax=Apatococcus fuscideae TaxID=2026836 RepID=A0AAW1SXU4_9CHLO